MKVSICDECKAQIPPYAMHWTLVNENTPTTFYNAYTEKQFCNAMCLAKFAANLMGKELVDVDSDSAGGGNRQGESGDQGVAQGPQ